MIKNDIVKVVSRHKLGEFFSMAKEVYDEDGKTLSVNYYRICSIEDKGDYYYVTMVPDTILGVYNCGFACKKLYKTGKSPKPFGCDWEIVDHREPYTSQPICLKGNPGYDLMM